MPDYDNGVFNLVLEPSKSYVFKNTNQGLWISWKINFLKTLAYFHKKNKGKQKDMNSLWN